MIREIENPDSEKAKRKYQSILAATCVITISESTRQDLLNLLPLDPKKVTTVHLAASDFFQPVSVVDAVYSKPYVLYVGQRSGYKNFLRFSEAFSMSANLRKDFNIHVFGGGAFSREELQKIAELNLIKNIVKVDGDDYELRNQYQGARALVYPSIMEGFGIPLVEAMMSGCPVICSNTSSIPEVAGYAGGYFDPTSIESMTFSLRSILSDDGLLHGMRERGFLRSRDFSWMKSAEETNEVYKETRARAF
jgi:glycosyltransferase involved in cell wall biosynthesis